MISIQQHLQDYAAKLGKVLADRVPEIETFGHALRAAWQEGRTIYLCGNGGSAGNAIHLANDFLFGAGVTAGRGLKIEALPANSAVLTALANDIGYEEVFAEQLKVKAMKGDVLVVFSGSGNSKNVVRALETGNALGMTTFAVLAYSGGRCKELAQHPIHFPVDDMQIAEDLQLIVGHVCMQWLKANPVTLPERQK